MSILFSEDQKIVHITNASVSYVMEVVDGKYLVHRYFGKAIRQYRGCGEPHYFKRGYNTEYQCSIPNVSFDDFPFEYPTRGHGDFRIPAFAVTQESGIDFTELLFKSWRVVEGKPKMSVLPATFAEKDEAETLEIFWHRRSWISLETCVHRLDFIRTHFAGSLLHRRYLMYRKQF